MADSLTLETGSEPPDDKDAEIAALKRRVAELEASQAKPKPPPVSLAPASLPRGSTGSADDSGGAGAIDWSPVEAGGDGGDTGAMSKTALPGRHGMGRGGVPPPSMF